MTQLQILKAKLAITGITEDSLLTVLLNDAKFAILSKLYPYAEFPAVFPTRYEPLQVKLAVVYYNKMGAEGQSAHGENGISRTFDDEDTLLKSIVPYAGLFVEEA